MDAEHLAARLGPKHRGVPLEAGQPLPDLDVVVLGVGQLGQRLRRPSLGQLEVVRASASPNRRAGAGP